jgi:hypothetical protein
MLSRRQLALCDRVTGVLPGWWAIFSVLLAVVLWIGPIGWAALILGTPIWVLGTTILLVRPPQPRRSAVVAGVAA